MTRCPTAGSTCEHQTLQCRQAWQQQRGMSMAVYGCIEHAAAPPFFSNAPAACCTSHALAAAAHKKAALPRRGGQGTRNLSAWGGLPLTLSLLGWNSHWWGLPALPRHPSNRRQECSSLKPLQLPRTDIHASATPVLQLKLEPHHTVHCVQCRALRLLVLSFRASTRYPAACALSAALGSFKLNTASLVPCPSPAPPCCHGC